MTEKQSKDDQGESPETQNLKSLESKVSGLTDTVTNLSKSVETLAQNNETIQSYIVNSMPEEEEREEPTMSDEDKWDAFRVNPKKAVQDVAEQVGKEVKKEVRAELKVSEDQKKYDAVAFTKFPQLRDAEHALRKEAEAVIKEKEAVDKTWGKRATALLDAAEIAHSRLVTKGEIIPEKFKSEVKRYQSITDGALLPVNQSSSENPEERELTNSQKIWQKRLKVDVKAYKKQLNASEI